jgi:S-adenosyl-L-methionine hydrolase (adenosine-forming)
MILLFTDFGAGGPYVGQMLAVLHREAPGVPVVDLMSEAPAFDARASAYLLAALVPELPEDAIVVAVVDPGVGGARAALAVEADGRRLIGPDNGLLAIAARRAGTVRWSEIVWRPERLSASFHGRDLFAPAAARLATGRPLPLQPFAADRAVGAGWPDELDAVVHVDRYGNAVTGRRAATLPDEAVALAGGRRLVRARTFSDLPAGQPFWYENANGLAELAVNRHRADTALDIGVGSPVVWE